MADTVQDKVASVNDTGAVLLVAQYGAVLVALHLVVLVLFVPFTGARFYYSFISLVPTAILAIYTIFFGTRSRSLALILFAGALLLLLLTVVELVLRTMLFGNDRLVSIAAVLDVVLWIVCLLYVIIAIFWVLSSYRLRSVVDVRTGVVNSDEQTTPTESQRGDADYYQAPTTRSATALRRRTHLAVDMGAHGSDDNA